jgi:hypothetical protein
VSLWPIPRSMLGLMYHRAEHGHIWVIMVPDVRSNGCVGVGERCGGCTTSSTTRLRVGICVRSSVCVVHGGVKVEVVIETGVLDTGKRFG